MDIAVTADGNCISAHGINPQILKLNIYFAARDYNLFTGITGNRHIDMNRYNLFLNSAVYAICTAGNG